MPTQIKDDKFEKFRFQCILLKKKFKALTLQLQIPWTMSNGMEEIENNNSSQTLLVVGSSGSIAVLHIVGHSSWEEAKIASWCFCASSYYAHLKILMTSENVGLIIWGNWTNRPVGVCTLKMLHSKLWHEKPTEFSRSQSRKYGDFKQ